MYGMPITKIRKT